MTQKPVQMSPAQVWTLYQLYVWSQIIKFKDIFQHQEITLIEWTGFQY